MKARLLPILVCAAAAAACRHGPKADQEAALQVVRSNVQLMQDEKIDEMMATIHSQSPAFAETRAVMQELVKKFDLKCELSGLKVLASRSDEIRVRFDQATEKTNGETTEPKTRVVGIHVLRKDGGLWKIFATEVLDTELLSAPDPEPAIPEGK